MGGRPPLGHPSLCTQECVNSIGRLIRLTTFGESHGEAVGGVLDGFPSGLRIDEELLQRRLAQRRGGQRGTTPRTEADELRFLSGLYEGRTTGTPLAFVIANADVRSRDYEALAELYRPGHADYTYESKYGLRDPRGGGRASARETVVRVVAGALCEQWLASRGVGIYAYLSAVGGVALPEAEPPRSLNEAERVQLSQQLSGSFPCPDPDYTEAMLAEIEAARAARDSVGGVVSCRITGLPVGLGEPLYDKCSARLASTMMSINAAKGFELGGGFALAAARGSAVRDEFVPSPEGIATRTNHSGGLLGGITTGEDLTLRVAFKPTSSISQPQQTVTRSGQPTSFTLEGRHDPCVALRAVPVVAAMAALTLADLYLEYLGRQAARPLHI